MNEHLPLFRHRPSSLSAFQPEALVEAFRAERRIETVPVPQICVLDFDGILSTGLCRLDWLIYTQVGRATMYSLEIDGMECGIIARTIGGPYAVLVAEQLHVSGAYVLLALTSAGRVRPSLPVPSLVVATSAIRDEGTSYHYLPAAEIITASAKLAANLYEGLQRLGLPVSQGACLDNRRSYRETAEELAEHAANGALGVEMQAASLFAFAQVRHANVGVVAHVTNAIDHTGEPFDKGSEEHGWHIAQAMCRACIHKPVQSTQFIQ
jgi:uridine phosphorylase